MIRKRSDRLLFKNVLKSFKVMVEPKKLFHYFTFVFCEIVMVFFSSIYFILNNFSVIIRLNLNNNHNK